MSNLSFDALKELVLKWNIDFPIDRWWRKTHSVAFNSKRHREVSFIDMFIEWEEEVLFLELRDKPDPYIPNSGNYINKQQIDESLSDEAFDNIDLDKL